MANLVHILKNIRASAVHVGYMSAILHFIYYLANRVFTIRHLEITILRRENLNPYDPQKHTDFASYLAKEEDIAKMKADDAWSMTDALVENYRSGDLCLLSSINGKLAGYTWAHIKGRPLFMENLRISIPKDYIYNFAAFTSPEFRGYGLQSYRHHQMLNLPELLSKKGMIGYVECTNWSSKRGQAKSGYQYLGALTLIGTKKYFFVYVSKSARDFGVRRLRRRED